MVHVLKCKNETRSDACDPNVVLPAYGLASRATNRNWWWHRSTAYVIHLKLIEWHTDGVANLLEPGPRTFDLESMSGSSHAPRLLDVGEISCQPRVETYRKLLVAGHCLGIGYDAGRIRQLDDVGGATSRAASGNWSRIETMVTTARMGGVTSLFIQATVGLLFLLKPQRCGCFCTRHLRRALRWQVQPCSCQAYDKSWRVLFGQQVTTQIQIVKWKCSITTGLIFSRCSQMAKMQCLHRVVLWHRPCSGR